MNAKRGKKKKSKIFGKKGREHQLEGKTRRREIGKKGR